MLHAVLALALAAERKEGFALEVEHVLLGDLLRSAAGAAAQDRGDLAGDEAVVLGRVAVEDHIVDHGVQGRDAALAGEAIGLRGLGLVAALRHADDALLGLVEVTRAVKGDAVVLAEVAKGAGFHGAGGDAGEGDVLEDAGDEGRGVDHRAVRDGLERAPEHIHMAGAAGDKTDADFDKTDVGLGVSLDGIRSEGELAAAADDHRVRRRDNRHRRVLHLLGRVLERFDHRAELVPLLLLRRHDDAKEVCAQAEVLAFVKDEQAFEVVFGLLDRFRQDRDDAVVDAIGLRLEGEPKHAVAEVPSFGAAVLENRRFALAHVDHRGLARVLVDLDVLILGEAPDLAVAVEAAGIRFEHLVDAGGELHAVGLHALGRLAEAEGIPGLEGSEFPVVAPLHGVIDRDHALGDLRNAARRVSERAGEHLPGELTTDTFGRDELLHAVGGRSLDALHGLLKILVAALRTVLKGL